MYGSPMLGSVTQLLLAAGILVSVAFYLVGYYGARDFFRRGRRRPALGDDDTTLPGVTILKPLKGLDIELYENIASFCQQDYPRFQIVFGVADADDPAVGVVRRLQAVFADVRIDLVIDGRVYGSNYKVSNLQNMYGVARHEVIVIADSDIRVARDYLRRLVTQLHDPQVGLVTCLYRAVDTGGGPTRIESLFINTDFAPMVLVARVVEKPSYAFGATIAVRRKTLDEIGGFLPIANYLADDYQLGYRISERGYRLALSDLVVETVLAVGTWRRLFDHQLRWARTYRSCRPGGYFGSVFTHGTLWATLNLLFNQFSAPACLVAACVYALRIATASVIANRYIQAPLRLREALLVPLKDLLVSGVWLICFLGDTVRWSGHDFRVLKDGQMVRVSPLATRPVQAGGFPVSVSEEHDHRAASL
jgi:ceramide glucosyltransferase